MMLIADSGATKADWRFIQDDGKIQSFSTAGLSPLFWTSKEMTLEINRKFPKRIMSEVKSRKSEVYFYGTSCSSQERIKIVQSALKKAFPRAKTHIHHDILASARAVCGNKPGIACILGTGSNSCYYDGSKIVEIKGGLTYILGDEGSGAHIGLEFIKAFLNKELPENIHTTFVKEYRLSKDKIIDAVYNQKYPNRFLASFAKFAHEHLDDAFVRAMLVRCMTQFFDRTICKYENYQNIQVGFVGSIAGNFEQVLREIARDKNVTISKIINSPIDELLKYHLSL